MGRYKKESSYEDLQKKAPRLSLVNTRDSVRHKHYICCISMAANGSEVTTNSSWFHQPNLEELPIRFYNHCLTHH
jgi:hypothetical protein